MPSQRDHSRRHDDKREQRPDIRQVGERADIPDAGRNADHQARDPGADMRRLEPRVHSRKERRQQPVARHRKPDTRLPVLKHQQRGQHPEQRAGARQSAARLSYPRSFSTVATGAALLSVFQFATPVSTSATLTYRTVQISQRHQDSERQIALRLRHSSAAVETESKPM